MKKLTRKLFISVLVAVFAFVALGTSTYAWITINTTAEVQEFEAKVDAGTAGIELCEVGQTNWSAVLTLKEDFTSTGKELDDLTSADGKTFYNMESNGSEMNLTAPVTGEDGYIEFQIKIRRTNVAAGDATEQKVKIDGSKVIFTPVNVATGTNEYEYVDANGITKSSDALYATNALRMSLTWEKEAKTVIYQQKEDTTEDPNGNSLGYDPAGFAHVYAEDQGITIDPADYAVPTVDVYECGDDVDDFITLTGATEETITVRLWIEGWDNECHSKILSQSFSVAFGFGI